MVVYYKFRRRRKTFIIILTFSVCYIMTFVKFLSFSDRDTLEEKVELNKVKDEHGEVEEITPILSPLVDTRWRGYPNDSLQSWSPPNEIYNDPRSPGHLGQPVLVPDDRRQEATARFKEHQVNIVASDLIPPHRNLPDIRQEECRTRELPALLPSVSVVVVFHNEPLSLLARTVTSVITRSPASLLQEVLLVDDSSKLGEVRDALEKMDTVRVIRLGERQGLIRARLEGAKYARGQVLVFLDSHVEVMTSWLEPLLEQISMDRTTVAVPVVDNISDNTMALESLGPEMDRQLSGFDWKLYHAWVGLSPVQGSPVEPFATPTMVGCAFAVDRDFFWEVGGYDDQMDIWGGENIEQSVRTWLCGGSLKVVPCSHVGHVFRDNSPHSYPGMDKAVTTYTNTARWAKVWMDDLYHFYLALNPASRHISLGNLTSRTNLRIRLKCRNFQWYLDHVYKDAPLPHSHQYVGEINAGISSWCLDAMGVNGHSVRLRKCHGLGGFQTWLVTASGQLQSSTRCVEPSPSNQTELVLTTCSTSPAQQWIPNHFHQLQHITTGLCITHDKQDDEDSRGSFVASLAALALVQRPALKKCQIDSSVGQSWKLNSPLNWRKATVDTIQ